MSDDIRDIISTYNDFVSKLIKHRLEYYTTTDDYDSFFDKKKDEIFRYRKDINVVYYSINFFVYFMDKHLPKLRWNYTTPYFVKYVMKDIIGSDSFDVHAVNFV